MLIILSITTTSLGVWSIIIEPDQLHIHHYRVEIDNWPNALDGFSIAFIADPHVGSPHITLDKLETIVEKTNALSPDLILLGGDYVVHGVVGGTKIPSQPIINILTKLTAKYGVYAVLGNHEWWEDYPRIYNEFLKTNIHVLEDKSVFIEATGKAGFWLIGISDYYEGPHNLTKAMASIHGNAPIIGLTHTPDIFPELPSSIALTLAGHTHGGQAYIPFLGRPAIPSRYGQRYAMGLIRENNKQYFVSPGIGTSALPIRFLTPPEISVLHIHALP